jgi:hypothetical protein
VPSELAGKLEEAGRALMRYLGVKGTGYGFKERRGALTETPSIRVCVGEKRPIDGLHPDDVVPAWSVLPKPGAIVGNLRRTDEAELDRSGRSGVGTVSFLALVNGTRSRRIVLVSNRHVLLAHGGCRGDPLYRPSLSPRGSTSVVSGAGPQIAEVEDEGVEDNHRFRYDGEAESGYFVDCATARLTAAFHPELTPLLGSDHARSPVVGVRRLHALDVIGARAPRVRALAGVSGTIEARVLSVAAAVEVPGGPLRLNNVVIRCAAQALLAQGDSGALLLDERDRAVGMVWGRDDRDPSLAYASHIHPVLDRLGVTMLTRSFP